LPEQAEIALYVDLEISTRPEMYQCAGDDSSGCIFRMKYAGPGLYDYGGTTGSTDPGSNITDTAITLRTLSLDQWHVMLRARWSGPGPSCR